MNIQDAVQTELNGIIEDGTLKAIIRKQLTDTVNGIVRSSTETYSTFGKNLKTVIEQEVLKIDLSNFELVDYNKMIGDIIREQLDKGIYAPVSEQISKTVQELTGFLEQKEWALSTIIEKYIKELEEGKQEDGEYDSGKISFHVDDDGDFVRIYWDEEERKDNRRCKYQMTVYKGKFERFTIEDYSRFTGNIRKGEKKPYNFEKFDRFLFNLYNNDVTIIVDDEDVNTYWSTQD